MKPIETERLLLQPIEETDLPFFFALHADPDVARYLSLGRPRTEDETREWFEGMLDSEAEHGVSHLVVLAKETGERLGRAGLFWFELEEPSRGSASRPLAGYFGRGASPSGLRITSELEVGYAISPAHWGRGLATEAARALRDYAFRELEVPRAMSVIHPENAASAGVARKNGMTLFDRIEVMDKVYERWLIVREEWERLAR